MGYYILLAYGLLYIACLCSFYMLEELGMVAAAGQGVRGEVPDSSQEGGRHTTQPSQTQLSGTTLGGWSAWHRCVLLCSKC